MPCEGGRPQRIAACIALGRSGRGDPDEDVTVPAITAKSIGTSPIAAPTMKNPPITPRGLPSHQAFERDGADGATD